MSTDELVAEAKRLLDLTNRQLLTIARLTSQLALYLGVYEVPLPPEVKVVYVVSKQRGNKIIRAFPPGTFANSKAETR